MVRVELDVAYLVDLLTLAPVRLPDHNEVVRLAEMALKALPGDPAWALTAKGAALLRAGRVKEAREVLEQAITAKTKASRARTMFFMALSCQAFGEKQQAAQWLQRARKEAPRTKWLGNRSLLWGGWHSLAELDLLEREIQSAGRAPIPPAR
jgi:Flp pilus assembly protein TadD